MTSTGARSSWSHVPYRIRAAYRQVIAATLPAPCPRCGLPVMPGDRWDVDHLDPVVTHPESVLDLTRMAAAHYSCNRGAHTRRRGVGGSGATGYTAPWLT